MPNKDDYVKPTYGDNEAEGGGRVKADPLGDKFDHFSEKWQKKQQERREQSKSDGQGSSRGGK